VLERAYEAATAGATKAFVIGGVFGGWLGLLFRPDPRASWQALIQIGGIAAGVATLSASMAWVALFIWSL
jgi:hypothetical protein